MISDVQKILEKSMTCKINQSQWNLICIPESFNTNISHQLFDYTITFVDPQH